MRVRWFKYSIVILALLLCLPLLAADSDEASASLTAQVVDNTTSGDQAPTKISMGGNSVWVPRDPERAWWPYAEKISDMRFTAPRTEDMAETQISVNGVAVIDIRSEKNDLAKAPKELLINEGEQLTWQQGYYLVKIQGDHRTQEQIDQLTDAGAILGEYLPVNTYIAAIPSERVGEVKNLSFVTYCGDYQPLYKISPAIGTIPVPVEVLSESTWRFEVSLHKGANVEDVLEALSSKGIFVEESDIHVDEYNNYITFYMDPKGITEVAKIPGVKWISEFAYPRLMASGSSPATLPMVLQNNGTFTTSTATGWKLWNAGIDGNASGTAQIISMMDTGLDTKMEHFAQYSSGNAPAPSTSHRKVYGYYNAGGDTCVETTYSGGHGTWTSQHAAGSISNMTAPLDTTHTPNTYYDNGIARDAKIYFEDIGTSTGTINVTSMSGSITQAISQGSYIQNNSWGTTTPSYNANAQAIDSTLFSNPNMTVTVSAGNNGTSGTGTLGDPATAKNCIAVGGVGVSSPTRLFMDCTWDGTTTCGGTDDLGSARGPVSTSNRIKPDICGYMATAASVGGENMAGETPTDMCQADATRTIYWDWTNASGYGGTSFAAPQIAGLAALVRDYFMAGYYPTGTATPANAFTPTGALVKAVILASGENLDTTAYPSTSISVTRRYSNDQGYGRANLPAVLKIGAGAPYLWAHDDNVTDGGTDTFTYTIGSNSMPIRIMMAYYDASGNSLQENINLRAVVNGNTYLGNVFTTGGWSTTGGTADATNNTEGIFLPTTAFSAGQTLTVSVIGVSNPGGQTYGIVVSGDLAEQGQGPTATMDKGRYVCGDTVYATISDTTGTPTNAVYHSTSGAALPATISGTAPNYTVSSVTTTQLGAVDGNNIWVTFTAGNSSTISSANSTLDCTPSIVIDSVDKITGGCDGDEFVDTNETVNLNVWLKNTETYALNMPFYADLVVDPAHPNANITIVKGTAIYDALQPNIPGKSSMPFQVRYTGTGTGPVTMYFKIQNIRSYDGTWTYNASATPLTFTKYADANWQNDVQVVGESFDGTTFPPTSWVRTQVTGTGTWARSTILYGSPLTLTPHSGAGLAEFDQTLTSASSARLATPVFSLSGYTGARATFYMSQTAYTVGGATATLDVQISTDGGTNYATLQTYDQLNSSAGTGAWLACSVDLTPYVGQTNCRLGFLGTSTTGMTLAIDDVWVGSAIMVNDTQTCAGAPVLTVGNYNWDFDDYQCNNYQGDPTIWNNNEAGYSIDAGESGVLSFYISNTGNEPAYDVQATLSCPSCPSGVTICKNTASYGNIPYGTGYAYSPGTDGFEIAVASSVPAGSALPFVLTCTTSNSPAYNPTINVVQNRFGSIRTGTPTNNVNGSSTWDATMEEHFTTALGTAGAGGRVGFTTAWTQTNAAISATDDSDGDGYSCRINVQRNQTNFARHAWNTATPILVNHDIIYYFDARLSGDSRADFSLQYTTNGTTWTDLDGPYYCDGTTSTNWYYFNDSVWFQIASAAGITEANAMYNNANFSLRFATLSGSTVSNTVSYVYVDNFVLAYYNYQNLTTSCSGICLGPEVPAILSIMDESACSQNGIRIYFDGAMGATRYDLVRDSSVVVTGYTTGTLYNPGDSLSHNYLIRAVNGTSYTADSAAMGFTDMAQSITPTITCSGTCTTGDTLTTESGMTNYQWYRGGSPISGANSYTYVATLAGTYTVSYTAGACTSNLSAGKVVTGASCTMTVDVTPNGTTTVCGGQNIVFTATPTGGTGPYTYQWTENGSNVGTNSSTYTANKTSGTFTYNCKVSDSGTCVDIIDGTDSTGTWTALPAAPTAGNNGPICAGSTLNLTASTISGATYAWTGPNGFTSAVQNPSITNATTAATGTYSVTATVSGCTGPAGTTNATVNATPAAPTAGNNGPICAGSTLNLTASTISGATYAWTGPNGFTSALQNPSITNATTAATGTYSVTATVSGCTGPAGTTNATVNAVPSTPTATNNGPICAGSTLNLYTDTVSGATYSWTGPNGFTSSLEDPSITNATTAATGLYSVTVTVGGCTSAAGTTTATVNAVPATPTATNNGPICAGSTLNLYTDTVSGATYSWTGPNGFTSSLEDPSIASATTAATGLYSVTVTVSGCTSAAGTTTATVNALPTPTISGATENTCPDVTVLLTTQAGMSSYQWYVGGSPIGGANASTYTVTATGSYTVSYVDGNGCSGLSAAHAVTINSCGCTAPTQEVIETVNGKIGFNWVDTDAAYYRVVRGLKENLAALITGGTDFACTAAFGDINTVDIQLDDPQAEAGRCYYYLIQGYNGTDPDLCFGPAGNATAGARQVELSNTCN